METSNSTDTPAQCPWLLSGLTFGVDALYACCPKKHKTCAWLRIAQYHGGPLPEEAILKKRAALLQKSIGPGDFCCCADPFLNHNFVHQSQFLVSRLSLSHFTASNLHCRHTHKQQESKPHSKLEEIGYDIYPVLLEMIEKKQLATGSIIHWGGGEPTLLPNLSKTVQLLSNHGTIQRLSTNATLFIPLLAEILDQDPNFTLAVKLDFGLPETYQASKGADLFWQALDNVSRYSAGGKHKVIIETIINEQNANGREVEGFLRLLSSTKVKSLILDIDPSSITVSKRVLLTIQSLKSMAEDQGILVLHGSCLLCAHPELRQESSAKNAKLTGLQSDYSKCSTKRPLFSNPHLDAAELAWWQKYSTIEEQFCWVQPEWVHQLLRADYIKTITDRHPSSGVLLELGCGSGWLSVLLAKCGIEKVIGTDFSANQIARAENRARLAGVSNKTTFLCLKEDWEASLPEEIDTVLLHAFLHHLTISEIKKVVLLLSRRLAKSGRIFALEPVKYYTSQAAASTNFKLEVLKNLMALPSLFGSRLPPPPNSLEQKIRGLINESRVGKEPFGPSPKEMPFGAEELPELFSPFFHLKSRKPVLGMAHLVARELLLAELSHPEIMQALGKPFLELALSLDRSLLEEDCRHPDVQYFELFEFLPPQGLE